MSKHLEIEDVDVVFTSGFRGRVEKRALNQLSMTVGGTTPTVTAVVGESGSGKTTLIRLLLGFQTPTRGRVLYDGRPVVGMGVEEQRTFRREVQAIFQDPYDVFNPFYRIDHPLVSPLKAFGITTSREESYERIEKALTSVGLNPADTLGRYPHQLSGGQRQRVMIARALLLDPAIILADEPVSMVDASLRSTILEILYGLNRDMGISLIYVTHDLTTAYQVADTIVVLYGGQVMEVGAAEDVIHRPRHPYTKALIEAVPSPDPDKPWNLDDPDTPARFLAPGETLVLHRCDPLRAVAGPASLKGPVTTVAAIQAAVAAARRARTSAT
jgi:peptide/nickel transport system ATP-binding protein